jgi:hypothetical protein
MLRFAGMSLEQIDDMDYRRLMRALAAQSVLEVEGRRSLLIKGVIKELSDEEAEAIAYHDQLVDVSPDSSEE